MQRIILSQTTTKFLNAKAKIKTPHPGISADDKEWISSVTRRIDRFLSEPYRIGETPLERINTFIDVLSQTQMAVAGDVEAESKEKSRKKVSDEASSRAAVTSAMRWSFACE